MAKLAALEAVSFVGSTPTLGTRQADHLLPDGFLGCRRRGSRNLAEVVKALS